jgi:hypothetical protein
MIQFLCDDVPSSAIEQLPLSLHRQYTLLRELDEQAQGTALLFFILSLVLTLVY